jgi:hypothetical protein
MKCGNCTACCDVFPVNWLNKEANTKCIHSCNGCNIHNIKPKECSDFVCSYFEAKECNEDLRPDKSGIIFEKLTDRLFHGTIIPGIKVTDRAKRQIDDFGKQGFSVVLYSFDEPKPAVFLSNKHKLEDINKEFQQYMKMRYGNVWN